jgi:PhnB protein
MTEQVRANEQDRIRAVVESLSSAIRARNVDRAVRHYAPDLVQFSMAPPLGSVGLDRDGLVEWFETWRGTLGYESRDLVVTAGPDVAFCTSLNRVTGTKTDGEKVEFWFRLTLGLRKLDGHWKIAHEHESVPFYMDGSLKAAIDLAP